MINVSTSEHAAAYMTKVTNAMDVVNQSMADLGSLMARMTDQTGSGLLRPDQRGIGVQPDHEPHNMAEEQGEREQVPGTAADGCCDAGSGQPGPTAMLSLFR